MPPGTRLGEFEVLRLLGIGGFGIVYLAFDHALEREVAVKEYMPATLAGRTKTMHVSLRSQSDAQTFALGLKSFVNEARLLARFNDPALLKVHRFWEANGTAYMAMPVMRGRTVKALRLEMPGPPSEAWLRALLEPLLGAIEKLHAEGVYHRDIAPDNIQIEPDGHPVLLDFGAARRVISDLSQTLTAILKPAYAPIEQYAEVGSVKQGPWTDIYALGATLHFLLLARPPAPATARAVHDDASALTPLALPEHSENFLHIVDWMLAMRPADRPQSIQALREVLKGRSLPPRRRVDAEPAPSMWERTVLLPPRGADPPSLTKPPETVMTGALEDAATIFVPRTPAPATDRGATAAATVAPPRSQWLTMGRGLGLGAAALAVAAAAMWWPQPSEAPPIASGATMAAVVAAAPAAAPLPVLLPPAAVLQSTVVTGIVPGETLMGRPDATSGAVAGAVPAPAPAPAPAPSSQTAATALPAVGSRGPSTERVTAPQRAAAQNAPPPNSPLASTAGAATTRSANSTPPPARPAPWPVRADPIKVLAAGPEAICSGRNAIRHFMCMERECLRSRSSAHVDCQKWHHNAKRE